MKSYLEYFGRGTRDVVVFDRMIREEGSTEKVTEKKNDVLGHVYIWGEERSVQRELEGRRS